MWTNKDVEIIVDWDVEVVGETVKVPSGPPESDGAGEHGPECEQQNDRQRPELVPPFTE